MAASTSGERAWLERAGSPSWLLSLPSTGEAAVAISGACL